uniref:Uncharacterized protein n=1 Tax=Candidatus Kentrum eta TaxID=2126337 RepID=A0A450UXB6_9GAMM|nr:MAG: hypothetical protein BECKH772A_GA0070896_101158 [Candidatus Kentron sp. H]VFJ97902.1 MAG: hypothetical protein BECKH772B_GA0070898_101218 [Candidatus Kentron sp. H]VFK03162.1 MAG: hypothetical protein BECKH772C_GA0070978_101158 [Candidatus Kentron sp. H]
MRVEKYLARVLTHGHYQIVDQTFFLVFAHFRFPDHSPEQIEHNPAVRYVVGQIGLFYVTYSPQVFIQIFSQYRTRKDTFTHFIDDKYFLYYSPLVTGSWQREL